MFSLRWAITTIVGRGLRPDKLTRMLLSLALSSALQIEPSRRLNENSLADAMQALDNLEQGAKYRQPTTEDVYLLGRLYFQIGVFHAVGRLVDQRN